MTLDKLRGVKLSLELDEYLKERGIIPRELGAEVDCTRQNIEKMKKQGYRTGWVDGEYVLYPAKKLIRIQPVDIDPEFPKKNK